MKPLFRTKYNDLQRSVYQLLRELARTNPSELEPNNYFYTVLAIVFFIQLDFQL